MQTENSDKKNRQKKVCAHVRGMKQTKRTDRRSEKLRREKVRSLQGKRALRVEQATYAAQLPTARRSDTRARGYREAGLILTQGS
jgi:hypothetical protein